mmetsp:Transcript_34160/g.71067  ORF Transcript_34160/g.71067 Transcript_34160/m.71067 type:complete len:137 (-) Transcript_34160:815-1225(-)
MTSVTESQPGTAATIHTGQPLARSNNIQSISLPAFICRPSTTSKGIDCSHVRPKSKPNLTCRSTSLLRSTLLPQRIASRNDMKEPNSNSRQSVASYRHSSYDAGDVLQIILASRFTQKTKQHCHTRVKEVERGITV